MDSQGTSRWAFSVALISALALLAAACNGGGKSSPGDGGEDGEDAEVGEDGVDDGDVGDDLDVPPTDSPACGNGVVDTGELCDTAIEAGDPGACPTACDDGLPCTRDELVGEGCWASCATTPITTCLGGDGCCPSGCTFATDTDCEIGPNSYWVDDDGAETAWAGCRSTTPMSGPSCCTPDVANAGAAAGDTVYYRGGTYTLAAGSAIAPSASGSLGNPITFTNYGGELVEFVNTSSDCAAYAVNLDASSEPGFSYIRVTGMTFTGFNRHMWLRHSDHNEISSCTFQGMLTESCAEGNWVASRLLQSSTCNHIHHCTFRNWGQYGVAAYSGGDDVGALFEIGFDGGDYDCDHNVVEDCEFRGGAHHVVGIHDRNNVFRRNYVHNEAWWPTDSPVNGNRIMMLIGSDGQRNLVEDNRIAYGGETSEGDQCGGSGGTYSSPYNIIRRNAIYRTLLYGMYLHRYPESLGGHDNKVYNNTFWSTGVTTTCTSEYKSNYDTAWTHAIFIGEEAGSTDLNAIRNNLFYQNTNSRNAAWSIIEAYVESEGGYTQPDLQVISGNWMDGEGDPMFASISGTPDPGDEDQFDFSLQAGSPCIDNGEFLTTVTSDSGSGTVFTVEDAGYFFDGWGIGPEVPTALIQGDTIQLEGQAETAVVTAVDYDTNTLTVDRSLTWTRDQGVGLQYSGTAPDQGAFEFTP
jgi:hypothetical protein